MRAKQILACLLCMLLLLGTAPTSCLGGIADWLSVTAAAETYSGECGAEGDCVMWSFDTETGELSISGTGKVETAPWQSFSDLITTAIIHEGIVSIGTYAFIECSNLESIVLPDSLEVIGEYAFCECIELKSVIIPNNVKALKAGAFAECFKLEDVTLPEQLEAIEKNVFYYCTSLDSIILPQTLKTIGNSAFKLCPFSEVYIPKNVEEIGGGAFTCAYLDFSSYYTYATLQKIEVDAENRHFVSVDGVLFSRDRKNLIAYPLGNKQTEYTVPDGVKTIAPSAFEFGDSYLSYICDDVLNAVHLPDTLCEIGEAAFLGCPLTDITIPDGVSIIGQNAFWDCKLSSAHLGTGVQTIGGYAFEWCDALKTVNIPDSVELIDSNTFKGCRELQSIYIGTAIKSIGENAFSDTDSLSDIYYGGNEAEWTKIITNSPYANIPDVTVHYNHYHEYNYSFTYPTCTADGYCLDTCLCGDHYISSKYTARGHHYVETISKQPTCTEGGIKTFSCSRCDDSYTEPILATGHSLKTVYNAPTCSNTGSRYELCEKCGNIIGEIEYIKKTEHIFVEQSRKDATCTEEGFIQKQCSECGEPYTETIPATGHSFGDWTQTKAPTVYTDGEDQRTCSMCGAKETQSIQKLPMPKVVIQHFVASSKTYDYRSSITFNANVENELPNGQIHWYVDGKDVYTGDAYTAEDVKQSFNIQAKYYVDSKEISEAATDVEKVNVNTGFIARLIAFFRALFGKLPKVVQEAYDLDRLLVLLS